MIDLVESLDRKTCFKLVLPQEPEWCQFLGQLIADPLSRIEQGLPFILAFCSSQTEKQTRGHN